MSTITEVAAPEELPKKCPEPPDVGTVRLLDMGEGANNIRVAVQILDSRRQYGRWRCLVTPVAGSGQVRVNASRLVEVTDEKESS